MAKIIGLSGSLRAGSYNTALLRAAAKSAPEGLSIEIASIREIPLYDGDLEAEGLPPSVRELKELIAGADGILIATPEYNHSMPGVLKNSLDWLSRPGKDVMRVFGGKAAGIIGSTPGAGGTRFAQTAWLPVFHALGLRIFSRRKIYLSRAEEVFDRDGLMIDEAAHRHLVTYLSDFATFADCHP